MALAEHIGEALDALHEPAHVFPVRHVERVAGRRPFPPTAVSRVIRAVKAQQVIPPHETGNRSIYDPRGGSSPAAAIVAFEPDARPHVEMRNRAGDLGLDEVFS